MNRDSPAPNRRPPAESRPRRFTLRDRVTLVAVAILALTLAIASLAANFLLSKTFDNDINAALRNRAAAQRVAIDDAGSRLTVRESRNDEVLDARSWVFAGDSTLVQSPAPQPVRDAVNGLKSVTSPTYVTVNETISLLAVPIESADGVREGAIVVGISRQAYERTEQLARIVTIVLDLIALLAAGFTVRWSVSKALRPVEEMTEKASDWSDHELGKRFDMGDPYDEITGLAATLDGLLARIDSAMRRERQLTAEIAHELRTPLAGIRAGAELARKKVPDTDRDALDLIIAGADRTNAAIETLLAAHSGADTADRWCDPEEAAANVITVSAGLARSENVTLSLAGLDSPMQVEVDADTLAQTLAPVVENAIHHARTAVRISLRRERAATLIRIQDDGAGFGGVDPETIFDPGVSSTGGAGLGLPLARRLATVFGGTLSALEVRDGAAFELKIPDSRLNLK